MKTLNILNNFLKMYGEAADATVPQPGQPAPVEGELPPKQEAPTDPAVSAERRLTTNEVALVELIKKALLMDPSPEDVQLISLVSPHIDQDNASEQLKTLTSIINKNSLPGGEV